jgi:integrase
MGRKRISGLLKIGDTWHIDKQVNGHRICESTGTSSLEEAERYLVRLLESRRQAEVYGIRPKRTFREAATKFLLDNQHKKSIKQDAMILKILEPFIGDLFLESIHMGTLQRYIDARKESGVKNRTINYGFQVVRRILNLASTDWMDELGLTWLLVSPKIKLLSQLDSRKPYPLNWEEQDRLFDALPEYIRDMALFAVNTGCRDQEVCKLKWRWKVQVDLPELDYVFIIPGEYTKNGEDRLVVLNKVALAVVEKQRGNHHEFVFSYMGNNVGRMLNRAWKKARVKATLNVRVHDLKHTFGRRLRSAGVSFEDRQDLLGHKSARITTHYSAAEILNLLDAANKVCEESRRPTLTLLRVNNRSPEKVPKTNFLKLVKSL